ncbi:MAG: L-rhamnose mutarotase [Tunicatimonas sp.]|uniref:L-rhamnose mutarotase n=1 Tax=Tunicatimonas sp. TaxID=1940096 RepID=UPI003C771FBE
MKDYAQTVNLQDDPEVIRQYEEYHANVWPEVLSALKEVGIIDMKIYRLGRRLFMFMQTKDDFDFNVDMPRYLTLHPRCQEWEDLMGTFQEKVPEAQPYEKWAIMNKVFEF